MTNKRISVFALVLLFAIFAVSGMASAAVGQESVCPKIPTVRWWGETSHQKIISYVARKHDGDWVPYIDKWNRQLSNMKAIYDRGGSAVFKKQGITIEDKELLQYIKAIEIRLSATRCLAILDFERAATKLSGMETASGPDEPAKKGE